MDIKIIDNSYQEVIRECDHTDEWDRDDTREEHEILGIEKVDKKGYRDLTVAFKVEKDRPYYLVYVLYDTGDSFGRDENRIEFVDLYQSKENAEALKKLIEENHAECHDNDEYSFEKRHSLKYKNEEGNEVTFSKSWEGYFENFNGCHVQEVYLKS